MSTTPANYGVPQGSPCSPVLFALTLAEAPRDIRPGISYVDDCSWIISLNSQREFKQRATELLDEADEALTAHGFQMDEAKTEVAWIFASGKPGAKIKEQVLTRQLKWVRHQAEIQHTRQTHQMAWLLR